jgi:magnesium transporter
MISINVHTEDGMIQDGLALGQVSDVLEREDSLLWLDVRDPTERDMGLLREEFHFHPLALEDAMRPHQRPKVDQYDGYAFLIFYRLLREADGEVTSDQVGIFLGRNFIVTVHRNSLPSFDTICARWQHNVHETGGAGVGLLLHSVLDALVDEYMPLMDDISDEIDVIEDRIFLNEGSVEVQQDVLQLKKNLLAIRRVAVPERDVLNELMRQGSVVFSPEMTRYLLDVYDHLVRTIDAADLYRDLLSTVLDSYLSVASNRLNQVMKTLTASSIILMGTTLVASVYGMNFSHMPELGWRLGYPFALMLMAGIAVTLFAVFRRMDWL